MFGAVYLLMHDKPIQSLVALIVALASQGVKNLLTLCS